MSIIYTGESGYTSAQAKVGAGIIDTKLQISPTPVASEAGSRLAVKKVPTLSALNLDRATLLAVNAVRLCLQAIFAVGDCDLWRNGAAISAALAATQNLNIAYPLPAGGFAVSDAGFEKPAAPAAVEGPNGAKNIPAGTYWIAVARKRQGFSGQGNPSDRVPVVLTPVNKMIRISLGAFATSEGQTARVVLVNRIDKGSTSGWGCDATSSSRNSPSTSTRDNINELLNSSRAAGIISS